LTPSSRSFAASVGTGSFPSETWSATAPTDQIVDTIRGLKPSFSIRGNHDKVCCGIEDGELFNRIALEAAMWTRRKLTQTNLRWLTQLPRGPLEIDGQFAIAHGTPIDEDAYIFGEIEALNVFRSTPYDICFFGHSHFPVVFALSPDSITTMLTRGQTFRLKLEKGVRYLINPGSVGQPRDGCRSPRSRYSTAARRPSRSTASPTLWQLRRHAFAAPACRARLRTVWRSAAEAAPMPGAPAPVQAGPRRSPARRARRRTSPTGSPSTFDGEPWIEVTKRAPMPST